MGEERVEPVEPEQARSPKAKGDPDRYSPSPMPIYGVSKSLDPDDLRFSMYAVQQTHDAAFVARIHKIVTDGLAQLAR